MNFSCRGFLSGGSVLALLALALAFSTLGFPAGRVAHAQTTYTYKGTSGTTSAPSDGFFFNGFDKSLPQSNGSYGASDATFVFGGTSTYTATDNLTNGLLLSVLQFTNTNTMSSTEKVTLARGGSGASNTLTFVSNFNGAKILLNNSGAVQVNLDMVFSTGSSAATTVSGSGSATFTGALSGSGNFTYAGSSGSSLTLTGVSTLTGQLNFNGGTTRIVTAAGSSTAARLSTDNSSTTLAYIGNASSDNGTILVSGVSTTGTASTLNAYFLNVGYSGTGTLNVLDGATVNTTSFGTYIGAQKGGTGDVTVSGVNTASGTSLASTLNTGGLIVGGSGTGTLKVLDGARVIGGSANSAFIGASTGSTGTVTVSGVNTTGSTPLVSTLSAGYLVVGFSGTGTLNVMDGATVYGTQTISIGSSQAGKGTLTVSGVNAKGIASTVNLAKTSFNPLAVGESGTGVLNVLDGAAVNGSHGMDIGGNAGGAGTVTVSGVNVTGGKTFVSSLNVGDFFFIGDSGTGTLNITNGGKVTADFTILSYASGSSSSLIINGGSLTTNNIGNSQPTVTAFKLTNPTGGGYALNIGGDGSSIYQTSFISAIISDAAAGDGSSGSVSGGPGGAGGINKTGTGTLTLTGASTFSGGVNIAGGTVIASSTGLGTGLTTVGSAGTLSVGSAVNTTKNVQSVGTLTARALTINANGSASPPQLTFNIGPNGVSDQLFLTDTSPNVFSSSGTFYIGFASASGMSLGAGDYTLITFTGQSSAVNLPDINLFKATRTGNMTSLDTPTNPFQYVTANGQTMLVFSIFSATTPEPSSVALLVMGLGGGLAAASARRLRRS